MGRVGIWAMPHRDRGSKFQKGASLKQLCSERAVLPIRIIWLYSFKALEQKMGSSINNVGKTLDLESTLKWLSVMILAL